jgi:hypothetical protein
MSHRFLILMFLAVSVLAEAAIVMHPNDDKRKAFPLPDGKGSRGLQLSAALPWRIAESSIIARDSATMWSRQSSTYYNLVDAYAPEEYVVIYGWLTQDHGGDGSPPEVMLTVPAIDLQWDEECGGASQERYEDNACAALLVTSDKNQHRHLILNPAMPRTETTTSAGT